MKRSARSTRFPLALHVMCMLAYWARENKNGYLTSRKISYSVAKNEVIVRQVLGMLLRAGLVNSVSGCGGGAQLAKAEQEINLLDIYKAVEEQSIFGLHSPNDVCPVARYVEGYLGDFLEGVERRFENELNGVLLSDVMQDMRSTLLSES